MMFSHWDDGNTMVNYVDKSETTENKTSQLMAIRVQMLLLK